MFKFNLLITACLLTLLQIATGLVPCLLNGVGTQDGADGYFHILDFLLTNQSLPTGPNVTVTFTLNSAFDNSSLACFGQLIAASMTMDPGGWVNGKCIPKDPNAALGDAPTNFSFGLTQMPGNNDYQFRIDQKLQCQPSNENRPYVSRRFILFPVFLAIPFLTNPPSILPQPARKRNNRLHESLPRLQRLSQQVHPCPNQRLGVLRPIYLLPAPHRLRRPFPRPQIPDLVHHQHYLLQPQHRSVLLVHYPLRT